MVIQGFNVSVSSQRTSLSVQSSSITASNSQHSAQFSGGVTQGGNTEKIPENSTKKKDKGENEQGQNQSGQGQNQNGNGNNGNGNGNIGLGQNQNGNGNGNAGLGHNQNGNGNIGLGQNQNGNGNGQGVNIQRQNNKEAFQALLENAREETVGRLVRGSPASRISGAKRFGDQRIPATPTELRAKLSQMIYEILTSRFNRLRDNQNAENVQPGHPSQNFNFPGFFFGSFGNNPLQQVQGSSVLHMQAFQYESEAVSYQATGVVHTADGRTITVDINMNMSREFVSFMGISAENGALVDPLVINYGGTVASLLNERFMFDLTSDGNLDNIAMLGEGSGFLAIDKNGDRKIHDGSQLFGPNTGCGFDELRKYDTDGNGWIDENDEIFDKLVVWRRDADGNDIVYTLKELGIGAIFLGDISTEYSFKGENNTTLGVMRSTSFFIKQCGGSGTLSHVDLAM